MDNYQNFDDTTTDEDSAEDANVPCDPDKWPQGCYYPGYYKSCAYGSSSGQECIKYYICQKSECGCRICDDCYKDGAHHGHNKWIKEKDNTRAVMIK